MKKILQILTNPMLLSIIGLIALAIIVWFGGPLIGIGESKPLASEINRLIVILIVTILWGLNNFRKQSADKKKDANLMQDIAKPDAKLGASEEESEEAKAIQQHFSEAQQILKLSKKHKTGQAVPIHELPWYIIIGPPGSGKTTALVNSGLRFPLAEKMGQQPLKGVGGTRNCDWWFSDDAILIDTAGRYTTQDSDRDSDALAWKGFLKLLRKHRPRQPINGAIVAISLGELLTQSETERQEHAQIIKKRLQELYDNLGIQFPVYVMLTKTDLIAGFNEFFENLSKPDREQILGMTFPANEDFESQYDTNFFKEQFNAILKGLNSRLQWRLQEERDLSRRALILNFPTELASVKEMVSQFLDAAFSASHFDKPVNLRGIYLTSGTQEGTPIDRVMGAMATNFGLNRQTIPSYSGQGKSFFLTQMFRNVIFPEAVIAGTNRIYEQKQVWLRRGSYVAALIVTIASIGVWTSNYSVIKNQIEALTTQISQYQTQLNKLPPHISDPSQLLASLSTLRNASTIVSNENRGLFSQAGLSQMRSLGPATDKAYRRALRQEYYPALVSVLESEMDKTNVPLESLFVNLKTYLMMADPKRFDKKEITQWYINHWEQEFAGNADKQTALKTHLNNLFEQKLDPIKVDDRLVADVRAKLQKIPLSLRIYGALKQQGSATQKGFFLSDILDTRQLQLFLNKSNTQQSIPGIPGLYTKDGYEGFFREESVKLAKASTQDDWVFGKSNNNNTVDSDQIHQEIENYYIEDFIKYWEAFYNSIKLAHFNSYDNGIDELEALAGDNSALMKVIDVINVNSDLRAKPSLLQSVGADKLKKMGSVGKKAAKKVKSEVPLTPVGKQLRDHFNKLIELTNTEGDKPPGIQKYLISINKLQSYLNNIMVAPSPSAAALKAAIARMNSNGNDVIGSLSRDTRRIPEPVNQWIKSLADNSWEVILQNSRAQINDTWKNDILARFERSLKSRYPIYKHSAEQTSLEDFSDFFAPGGRYITFLTNNIFPFVDTKGRTWHIKTLEDQNIGFSHNTLRELQEGVQLSKAFFGKTGGQINVRFQLTPTRLDANVKRVNLEFDGREFVYRHGPPRTQSYSWPFSDVPESSKVAIRFQGNNNNVDLSKSGTWALFQLLDEANVRSRNSTDLYSVNFKVKNYSAQYSLKAGSVNNPFDLRLLHSFRPPANL